MNKKLFYAGSIVVVLYLLILYKNSKTVKKVSAEDRKRIIDAWTRENEEFGLSLGYPKCCVAEFCNNPPELMSELDKKEIEFRYNASFINGVYSGLIPCKEHARMIHNNEIKITDLIKNRNADLPDFPNLQPWHVLFQRVTI